MKYHYVYHTTVVHDDITHHYIGSKTDVDEICEWYFGGGSNLKSLVFNNQCYVRCKILKFFTSRREAVEFEHIAIRRIISKGLSLLNVQKEAYFEHIENIHDGCVDVVPFIKNLPPLEECRQIYQSKYGGVSKNPRKGVITPYGKFGSLYEATRHLDVTASTLKHFIKTNSNYRWFDL
ncbi:TPA: hypothetical protein NK990_003909 [Vibrio parahaemolyticus]|nr:hypothetical protein [Vibrio parahaemolyticus]